MQADIKLLLEKASQARYLYGLGKITREEAEKEIKPYLDLANQRGKEIAKKYGGRFTPITLVGFLR